MKKLLLTLLLTSCLSAVGAEESQDKRLFGLIQSCMEPADTSFAYVLTDSEPAELSANFRVLNEEFAKDTSISKSKLVEAITGHSNYSLKDSDKQIAKRIATLKQVLNLSDDLFEESTSEDTDSKSKE